MFAKLTTGLLGSAEEFPTDERVLNGWYLVVLVSCLFGVPLILLTSINNILLYPNLAGGVAAIVAWYFGRLRRQPLYGLGILTVSQMFNLSMAYIYHAGAAGGMASFYMAIIALYLMFLKAPAGIITGLLLFANLTVLFLLELGGIIHPLDHRNASERIIELISTQFLCIGVIAAASSFANYLLIVERKKTTANNQAKTKFLANISHELRTPMNAILGMNELALSLSTDEQQKKWLQTSQVAAQHLLSLIEDVLDISSIDQGKLIITPQTIHLHDLVMGVIHILQPFAKAKQLTLELHLAENMPTHIQVDPVRLRQILVNLINNAIKFTDQGSVTVIITQEEGALHFSIQDTGLGIPAKDQQKIFEVFTQAKNMDAIRHKGFGLGLSISKQLVEKMGGTIGLNSQLGKGSIFFFSLPFVFPPEAKQIPESSSAILLVEDNVINVEVARIFLTKNTFTVDVAVNGQKALELLSKRKYTAILMDLEMPVMDGFETTQALRAGLAGSLNQTTPIIALTAHALPEYREKSVKVGMNGFIAKPINGTLLISELRQIIDANTVTEHT